MVGGQPTSTPLRLRTVDVLCAVIALLAVGNLGRVPLLSTQMKSAPLLLNDLLVLGVGGLGVVLALRNRRLVLDSTASLALAFAAVGGISAVMAVPRFGLTIPELLFSTAYLARWLAYFSLYVVVINWVSYADTLRLWRALEWMVLAFTGFGIFQSAFLPGFAQMVYPDSAVGIDWDYQGRRLVSTFLDPNFAGALIAMILLVEIAMVTLGAKIALWKLLLLGAGLVLTVSRSSMLAFMVGALFVVAARGLSRRLLKLGGGAAILLIPILPWAVQYAASLNKFTLDPSALGRLYHWVRALQMLAEHPLIGVGFNTYGYVQQAYDFGVEGASAFGLDGGLLFIAVMTGAVGVSIYTAMLVVVIRKCRRVWRNSSMPHAERGLALGAAAATLALVVHSVFVNSLILPFLMEPLWLLWALSGVVDRGSAVPEEEPRSLVLRLAPVQLGAR